MFERLAELQSVVVAGNTLGPVKPIARNAVAALTADLKPRQMQTPDAPNELIVTNVTGTTAEVLGGLGGLVAHVGGALGGNVGGPLGGR